MGDDITGHLDSKRPNRSGDQTGPPQPDETDSLFADNALGAELLVQSFSPVEPDPHVWENIEAEIRRNGRGVPRRPQRFWHLATIAASIILVGSTVVGLGLLLSDSDRASSAAAASVVRELIDPTTLDVAMAVVTTTGGETTARVVDLDPLPSDHTYQLWSVVGDEIVSVGLLGPAPGAVALRLEGDPSVLALTIEVAGGVGVSTAEPVAVWVAQG
jgi:hypothetical protein